MTRIFRAGLSAVILLLAVSGGASARHGGDFVDGLSGGPDFWRVTGVHAGDALRLRAAPSPRAADLGGLANGARLRNLGARIVGGARWRHVETSGGRRGWVNGRFLRE